MKQMLSIMLFLAPNLILAIPQEDIKLLNNSLFGLSRGRKFESKIVEEIKISFDELEAILEKNKLPKQQELSAVEFEAIKQRAERVARNLIVNPHSIENEIIRYAISPLTQADEQYAEILFKKITQDLSESEKEKINIVKELRFKYLRFITEFEKLLKNNPNMNRIGNISEQIKKLRELRKNFLIKSKDNIFSKIERTEFLKIAQNIKKEIIDLTRQIEVLKNNIEDANQELSKKIVLLKSEYKKAISQADLSERIRKIWLENLI